MENQKIKKRSLRIFSLWMLIAAITAGATVLFCLRFRNTSAASSIDVTASSPSTAPTGGASQQFSGAGFSFNVPASWYIEKEGNDSIMAYPDYSPSANPSATSGATCKIEISVFPFAPGDDIASWISKRLGADPSVVVAEQSSDDITVSGGTAVRWNGTVDGVPTTLVYAFGQSHAFEIAPSVLNETPGDTGNEQCTDALGVLISQLTLE